MNFAEALKNKFTGPEGAARMQGIGLLMSQLGGGQTPNAGPALQMLQERKAQSALKQSMGSGDFMTKFTPQEQAFLATLPPQAAQSLIAQRIFAAPPDAVKGTEINGQLVNPVTGEVMGDFRDPGANDRTRTLTPDEVDAMGLPSGSLWQEKADGTLVEVDGSSQSTSYVASGDPELGLDPNTAYNYEVDDRGNKTARAVGGGPLVSIDNGGETAFTEETGKIIAREAASIVEQGSIAQRGLGQLITLQGALESSPQGFAGALLNLAGNLGIKTDGSSDIEVANAIISQMVPGQRPPGSGTMSDADLALFKASLPRLINTPEGNQKIIDTMRSIAEYDVARMEIARQQQLGQIDARQAFSAYSALGNPLASFASGGSDPTSPVPAAASPAPVAPGAPTVDDLISLYGSN